MGRVNGMVTGAQRAASARSDGMTNETQGDAVEEARWALEREIDDVSSPPIRDWTEIEDAIEALIAAAEQRGREAVLPACQHCGTGMDGRAWLTYHRPCWDKEQGDKEALEAQLAQAQQERDIAKGFHDIAVQQRETAWKEIESLKGQPAQTQEGADAVYEAWRTVGHALSFGTEAQKKEAIEQYGDLREQRGKEQAARLREAVDGLYQAARAIRRDPTGEAFADLLSALFAFERATTASGFGAAVDGPATGLTPRRQ